MIEMSLADGPGRAVPLQLRSVRGGGGPPPLIDSLVVVGRPQTVRLTADRTTDDPELTRFIGADASRWHYHLVGLSCTFTPTDDQQLATAWIQVELANVAAPNAEPPVATSLEPLRLERIQPISVTAKIAVPCVFVSELGITRGGESRQVMVEARYEGTSRPAWHLTEASAWPISGIQRLRLIARVPANTDAVGRVSIGASIRYRRFGSRAFSYRSRTEGTADGPTFQLSTAVEN
ncbi:MULTISPECIES: hypothetical protein [unclassified Frankia]|uniref:hypothetical protein n=1 Tax=unclassified Frankia TaxID=2632575 RepID=UPI002AD42324|nr:MULTISPECIES: hypothetical protein [unclassified Frankia]